MWTDATTDNYWVYLKWKLLKINNNNYINKYPDDCLSIRVRRSSGDLTCYLNSHFNSCPLLILQNLQALNLKVKKNMKWEMSWFPDIFSAYNLNLNVNIIYLTISVFQCNTYFVRHFSSIIFLIFCRQVIANRNGNFEPWLENELRETRPTF